MFSLVVGHFQERVKININSNLDLATGVADYDSLSSDERKQKIESARKNVSYDYYKSHDKISYLFEFTISQLSKLKWGLTLILVVIHLVVGYLFLAVVGSETKSWLLWGYLLLFVAAGLFYVLGAFIEVDLYPFSRRVIGFLQSILPAGLLFMVFKLNKNNK